MSYDNHFLTRLDNPLNYCKTLETLGEFSVPMPQDEFANQISDKYRKFVQTSFFSMSRLRDVAQSVLAEGIWRIERMFNKQDSDAHAFDPNQYDDFKDYAWDAARGVWKELSANKTGVSAVASALVPVLEKFRRDFDALITGKAQAAALC